MKESFEKAIEAAKGTPDVGKLWLSYIRTGNAYPDNMNHYPDYYLDGNEKMLFGPMENLDSMRIVYSLKKRSCKRYCVLKFLRADLLSFMYQIQDLQ